MKRQGLILTLIALQLAGCATDEYGRSRPATKAEKGAVIGAVGGAVLGAAINHKNRGKGALIGAVGGGLAGAAIGSYMDNQARDLARVLAPEVGAGNIQIDKRADHSIKVTMTAATAFDSGSWAIKPGFYGTLDKIAKSVNTYGKTQITILGHTDDQGADQVNRELSFKRAEAVEAYLANRSVAPERLMATGRGEKEPIADNRSESGRARNRRVEIYLNPVRSEG
ncbi:OmpA family protein [Chitinimonas lacunae]|uniref:OmpA family protein n=1 Tax=Chitinimonas lacunae TaxID=1963018 RepID=A0ABV8MRN6_9NEIS